MLSMMYASLLSVLLIGMVPIGARVGIPNGIGQLAIAPPSPPVALAGRLSASGVLLMDARSGQVVYERDGRVRRSMASITKLMTALLIVENHDMDEIVVIPQGIEDIVGNKVHLPSGERFRVGDLLSALLISSANDAAVVLAEYHSGSVSAFVDAMNARATQLGMTNTSYANPAGLDSVAQYSTPRDTAVLTSFILRQPDIAKRMGRRWQRVYSLEGTELALNHTHALLHAASSPVVAGKTGTTDNAGQCLVSLIEQNGRQYIIVLFHSRERYADMKAILEAMHVSVV